MLYLIHQAFVAHIVRCSENLRVKNTSLLFRGLNWADICNLVQFLIFIRQKVR